MDQADEIARLAGGSMSAASALADPEASEVRERFVSRALAALASHDAGAALDLAAEAKAADKSLVALELEAFAAALARESRASLHAADRRADVAAACSDLAIAAIRNLEANAAPQLALEAMFLRMRAL